MSKINITMTSGSMLEKPLVSAFKSANGNYIVLDNEVNGTMGLPIILVSKFDNGKLIKIEDQNEWGSVKEILRNIIAGNQVDYITIPEKVIADDMFFSQLTLPIASFESLKSNYKPINDGAVISEVEVAPEIPQVEQQPIMPEIPIPTPMPNNIPEAPVMPEAMPNPQVIPEPVVTPVEQTEPVSEPVTPVMPSAPIGQTTDIFTTPEPVVPQVEPIPNEQPKNVDFSADKEAFMKACENMFDALVAKFNK